MGATRRLLLLPLRLDREWRQGQERMIRMAVDAISVTPMSRAVPGRPAVPGQKASLASRSVY
jgi:hypothetical protein